MVLIQQEENIPKISAYKTLLFDFNHKEIIIDINTYHLGQLSVERENRNVRMVIK